MQGQVLFWGMDGKKKLVMLDSLALIYRAHFALHKHVRTNSQGLDVGALLGFTNTLVDIIQKQSPTHIVAAFDSKAPTWRKELYADYKVQREAQPESITTAIPCSKSLLDAFGIPHIAIDGYEADDIIGTLSKRAAKEGFEVYIVSTDKDLGQLVGAQVMLCKPSVGGKPAAILGEQEIVAQWGIERVDQIPDMLGLWGDASDNIPGVPKVGPKTAQKLLASHGSIEGIFEHIEEVKGSLQNTLRMHEEQAKLSKQLATIATELGFSFDFATSSYEGPKEEALRPLLEGFEFWTLVKRLFPGSKSGVRQQLSLFGGDKEESQEAAAAGEVTEEGFLQYDPAKVSYRAIEGVEAVKELVKKLQKEPYFCFNTETTSLDAHSARLLGIAISYREGESYFIPFPTEKEVCKALFQALEPLFHDKKLLKIGQNIKYDLLVLANNGMRVEGSFFDTMIAHHLLAPGASHNLNALAREYLGYAPIEIETLIGAKGAKQGSLMQVPLDKLVAYACEDADITLQLYQKMAPAISQEGFEELFYKLEMTLLPVLVLMECRGVSLDTDMLKEVSIVLGEEIANIEEAIFGLAGSTFNIGSPKQLGKVLFEDLKIVDKPAKTAKGQYSTNERMLRKLIRKHPVINHILSFRELKKLKSTYVDALPMLLGWDNRLHTSYHQGFVSTGRLSSSNPNLQNIPIRTEKGKVVRRAFVPGDGYDTLLSADYSQIELRIIAAFSKDASMLTAFKEGRDIHRMTASQTFHVAEDEVTPDMRRQAKMVNFGIIYGISAFGLAERLEIPRREAANIIKNYFEAFPSVQGYMERVVAEARELGYVKTLLGRKRFLPDIDSRNATMRGFAERNAINMPIQGTAAELIQIAMVKVEEWLATSQLRAQMILQVHDELVFEANTEELPILEEKVPEIMVNALSLEVPLAVTVGVGKNWLDAH